MSDTRSQDYDFNPGTYQIITGALRLLSAIQSGETPPAEEYEDALAALNGVIKSWQANNLHVWAQTTFMVRMVAGQAQYTIGIGAPDLGAQPRPLRINNARLTLGQAEVQLIEMSRLDYANSQNKTSPPGPPVQWFYDPQLPHGIITLSPAPDAMTAANGTVYMTGLRPLMALDTQRDTADVPQEWISALRFALAVELAPEYDCPKDRFEIIKVLADEKLKICQGWDTEHQGTATVMFSQLVYQMIAGALRLCGGCGAQEQPVLGLINNGLYALNALVKAWQGTGIHIWTESDATLFLQPNQTSYLIGPASPDHCCLSKEWVQTSVTGGFPFGATAITVASAAGINAGDKLGIWMDYGAIFWGTVTSITGGSTVNFFPYLTAAASGGNIVITYTNDLIRPLKAPAARRYIFARPNQPGATPIEIPMTVLSRIDYASVPNKQVTGAPVSYFFDPQLDQAVMNIWQPVAAGQFNAIKFTAQMPLTTFGDLLRIDNFPAEWERALRFNLALELWPEHAERRAAIKGDYNLQAVAAMAQDALMTAQAWDREPESIYFGLQSFPSTRN